MIYSSEVIDCLKWWFKKLGLFFCLIFSQTVGNYHGLVTSLECCGGSDTNGALLYRVIKTVDMVIKYIMLYWTGMLWNKIQNHK